MLIDHNIICILGIGLETSLQLRLVPRRVLSKANISYRFLTIFPPHKPLLQASTSPIPITRIYGLFMAMFLLLLLSLLAVSLELRESVQTNKSCLARLNTLTHVVVGNPHKTGSKYAG